MIHVIRHLRRTVHHTVKHSSRVATAFNIEHMHDPIQANVISASLTCCTDFSGRENRLKTQAN
jgi:hypothetical protein